MAGKHVDWRVISAFPDYEVNPIGDVRTKEEHKKVHQFRRHGEWSYTLHRIKDQVEESWVVTKNGLIEVTFPDLMRKKISPNYQSY